MSNGRDYWNLAFLLIGHFLELKILINCTEVWKLLFIYGSRSKIRLNKELFHFCHTDPLHISFPLLFIVISLKVRKVAIPGMNPQGYKLGKDQPLVMLLLNVTVAFLDVSWEPGRRIRIDFLPPTNQPTPHTVFLLLL